MKDKAQLVNSIQQFLQKDQTKLKSKDYRSFFGDLKAIQEWLKRGNFTVEQLTTCQAANDSLREFINHYHTKLGISEENLTNLQIDYAQHLAKASEKMLLPNSQAPQKSKASKESASWEKGLDLLNDQKKMETVEKSLNWLVWFDQHKKAIGFISAIFGALLFWVIYQQLKEKLFK